MKPTQDQLLNAAIVLDAGHPQVAVWLVQMAEQQAAGPADKVAIMQRIVDGQTGRTRTVAREPEQQAAELVAGEVFKQFIEWASAAGYDVANTYDTDRSRWLCLNPMTAELWGAWQAAHTTGSKT